MGSWVSWPNHHNYDLYHMCASVHCLCTVVPGTNFYDVRNNDLQRVLWRQKLPNLDQVFPSVFGEDIHDPIDC